MKPESEWFRPPKRMEMCPIGDVRRFLWVAEPEQGQGVYGVGWEVAWSLLAAQDEKIIEAIEKEARAVLDRRIAAGDKHGEGEYWKVFEWRPIIKKLDAGYEVVTA